MRPTPAPTSRVRRIAGYLAEMFPPWVMVPGGLASAFGVYASLEALSGARPATFDPRVVAGCSTVVAFTLLLRIYDELKDIETDLRLGRAGDPRYVDRAIVTGRITEGDLVALRNGVVLALVALNVGLGWPWPGVAFAGTLFAAWLSSRWFFCPAMREHLLVAFVTHNPLSALFTLYVVALQAAERPSGGAGALAIAALVVGHWGPMAAWEIARKVRAPNEETDYVTYSSVLGPRVAGLAPIAFVGASVVGLAVVASRCGIPRAYLATLVVTAAPIVVACVRFAARPSALASRPLRSLAELYASAVAIATPIAFGLHGGVAWRW